MYQKGEKVSVLIDGKWKRGIYIRYNSENKIHTVYSPTGTFKYRVFDSEIQNGWGKK